MFSFYVFKNIKSDIDGYNQILKIIKTCKDDNFSDHIEFKINSCFDVNLCAFLGACMEKHLQAFKIHIITENKKLYNIGFLENFGYAKEFEKNPKPIRYFHTKTKERSKSEAFEKYLNLAILNHKDFPKMSDLAKQEMRKSIFEIFDNATIHSESDKIYACGFLDDEKHELHFSIVDSGIGFAKKINIRFNQMLSSENAIKWSIKEGHTTKKQTGGLGFQFIMEFIKLNQGKLQILSGNCLYEMSDNEEKYHTLDYEFCGSMVNMIFKTNDINSYKLKIEDDDLF
ncbi:sensor histidine kinase [Campylobacter peloridis]|uniref:Sensor histidine kinase n=2 Tax=Campylobacter peloridis TaxID=488546 RepID=A0A5C7DVP4_9BACT|nr:ATP-binding protein [Campylobacter peloridis]TXE79624.1 sensor histidine kinase [Campylobacter peloridis]